MSSTVDVAIVGGCGRVGLPLGLAFADSGLSVILHDINAAAVERVNRGEMPFDEPGAADVLDAVLSRGRLRAETDRSSVKLAEHIVVVIDTPIDEHLNPNLHAVTTAIEELAGNLVDGQLLVLRSTVYPGVFAVIERLMARLGIEVDVAYCPERIAEGRAMSELSAFPQIVAARSPGARRRATELFTRLTDDVVHLEPEEAELAKLFTNVWRYVKFATANQLFMMANDVGLDYERIRAAVIRDYPRAADLPAAGLTAGPCLPKATMHLTAFSNDNFHLGRASMTVNEGLPLYIVSRLEQTFELSSMTVGILGMAYKAESDDIRSSLSYELKRILGVKAKQVLTHDPYVTVDPDLRPLDEVLRPADLLVIGAPHATYRDLATDIPVIDIWNLRQRGVRI